MLARDPLSHLEYEKKPRLGWKAWLAGSILVIGLVAIGLLWLRSRLHQPAEAPEAGQILAVQANLPFQVLIPAFLPRTINRSKLQIKTGEMGPGGEAMIELTYPSRQGYTLTLREWISTAPETGEGSSSSRGTLANMLPKCRCQCQAKKQCTLSEMDVQLGPLHVSFRVSAANQLSMQEIQLILKTLGPATNSQVFSAIDEIPLSYKAPPAVEIPISPQGVQELTLVVSPQGYNPAHFSVKRGVPVRLIFRQIGQVGCGNELVFPKGSGKDADLILTSADDQQVLEFTPGKNGDFLFHCPHFIYQGVMTVTD